MADYTKATPGEPTSGLYAIGDTVRDSVGVTWLCVAAGLPGDWIGSAPSGTTAVPSTGQLASVATGVTVRDVANGAYHTTTLTLADVATTITDVSAFGGTKLFIFPQGRIYVTGVIAQLQIGSATANTVINDASTVDWALGSVVASNVALTGTMVNMAPVSDEAVIGDGDTYGTLSNSVLAAAAFFDGTTTAIDFFLNFGFSDATDIDSDGSLKTQGTIQITWQFLGDK